MSNGKPLNLQKLCESLKGLTTGQVGWVEQVVQVFGMEHKFWRLNGSDLVSPCLLQDFGDTLRIHHCFSREPFTKDKFEYALEQVANLCNVTAQLAPKGNPGHDITINEQRFSLKTQADKNLKPDKLHISKFMELGKGEWADNSSDLLGLREQLFKHLRSYDRILSLRSLAPKGGAEWQYELVEIPKTLLLEAKLGQLRMAHESGQMPKPGYCDVTDRSGNLKFQLYFDGGTERKLQIRSLDKKYCTVHATWEFVTTNLEGKTERPVG
ncbi:MAG: restriction endonuclease [Gammaproteobacteria bacterium]|jgi:type II restriction enzyme|nr:restriction endonuclease [Gammaproteobacteria bacterium]